MKKTLTLALTLLLLTGLFALSPLRPVSAYARVRPFFGAPWQDEPPTETPTRASAPTPAEVITAVNNLRLSHGLNALTTNSILMQVAADQANALAGSEGAIGHERSCGMTLGQDLLSRGYPLLGDLSLDGYRSENWVAASTTEDAINFWLSDDEHTNTMLSPNRNDIGAAVAVSDQIYVVLETAWSTSSGQMQYDAYPILTGIPQTQTACYGMYTEAAKYGVSNEYSIPVQVSTALPNGDVIHEVKYGQSLWTLAIQYQTTIVEIKRLNRLYSDIILPGQKLLIKTGATQPVFDLGTPSLTPVKTRTFPWGDSSPASATPSATASAISQPVGPSAGEFVQENSLVIVVLVISFSILLAGLGVFGRKKGS
jgi:uncharacterized protein YkwD/LysM repeat protein